MKISAKIDNFKRKKFPKLVKNELLLFFFQFFKNLDFGMKIQIFDNFGKKYKLVLCRRALFEPKSIF